MSNITPKELQKLRKPPECCKTSQEPIQLFFPQTNTFYRYLRCICLLYIFVYNIKIGKYISYTLYLMHTKYRNVHKYIL